MPYSLILWASVSPRASLAHVLRPIFLITSSNLLNYTCFLFSLFYFKPVLSFTTGGGLRLSALGTGSRIFFPDRFTQTGAHGSGLPDRFDRLPVETGQIQI